MSGLLSSSLGKKLVMSLSGLFLMVFLVVHLTVNMMLLVGAETFNVAANFMGTNPVIRIMEPILGLGLIVHIVYALILTMQNKQARPKGYAVKNTTSSKWTSRNMFVLGAVVLIFLVIHIVNFYFKIKFTGMEEYHTTIDGVAMHDTYKLVTGLFQTEKWYAAVYVLGAIFLGMHLSHGFWSAFQSAGASNSNWQRRLVQIGYVYTAIITLGFAIIPIYFVATA